MTLIDYETGEEISLPCRFEVCPRCEGKGVHDHPAFSNGISRDQFDEDPDFAEDYFKGRYDVRCSECNGERVVSVPDEEALTPEQARVLADHRNARAEEAAERRMRAQGIEF